MQTLKPRNSRQSLLGPIFYASVCSLNTDKKVHSGSMAFLAVVLASLTEKVCQVSNQTSWCILRPWMKGSARLSKSATMRRTAAKHFRESTEAHKILA